MRAEGSLALLLLQAFATAGAQVRVVDMIPRRFGNEVFQNSEPTLAVNPKNPAVMAASAYTMGGDICSRGVEAPIFASRDTGRTWDVVCKILVDTSTLLPPGDVMLRWSTAGRSLYATLLWPLDPYTLQIYQTEQPFSPGDFVTVRSFANVDQPDLAAIPARFGEDGQTASNTTRLFISGNFMLSDTAFGKSTGGTAGVVITGGWQIPPAPMRLIQIERRDIVGQNYATRLATHESGVVYAVFYSPRHNSNGNFVIQDVVIVREDSAGLSSNAFAALVDTPIVKGKDPKGCDDHDGKPEISIVTCRVVPYFNGIDTTFGFQRRVSANLSLAVDPENAKTVWVAWADSSAGGTSHYTLHVRRSKDGGRTWSGDLVTVRNATNPALAAGKNGSMGFLFQALELSPSGKRWVTRLYTSTNAFKSRRSYLLATTDARSPLPLMQPYIGDYVELRAVGDRFYGVFSASNVPDTLNFPNGIGFQRPVNLIRKIPVDEHGGFTVGISIDPFFFSVGPGVNPECSANARLPARPPMFAMIGRDSTRRGRALEIGCPP